MVKEPTHPPHKIVVVEDELVVAHDLKTTLESLGYVVPASATSAGEALAAARAERPDLILMDIFINGEATGIDAARAIRAEADIPVIYLTAYSDDAILEQAKVTAPYGFIVKPFQERELRSVIEMTLYKHSAEQRLKHLNAVLRAVRNVNQLITKEKDQGALLRGACNHLVETRGYYTAWIALAGDGRLRAAACSGVDEAWPALVIRIEGDDTLECCLQLAERANVLVIDTPTTACGDCPLANSCSHSTDRGAMSARLIHNGRLYGVLTVSAPRRFVRDLEEQSLLEELAGDLGFALHTMALERRQAQVADERERILTNSHDLICVAGMDGYFKYVNAAWERTLGYSEEELLSRPFLDFIHPDDHHNNDIEVARLGSGLETTHFENRYIHREGSVHTISWRARATPSDGLIYAFGRDITEQRQAEQDLHESRIRFARLFANSAFGIAICQLVRDGTRQPVDLECLEANEATLKHTGVAANQIVAKRALEIATPEEIAGVLAIVGRVVDDGLPRDHMQYFPVFQRTLELSAFRLEGDVVGLVFTDVTERRRTQAALAESEAKYRGIVDNIGIGIALINKDAKVLELNRQMRQWFPTVEVGERPSHFQSSSIPLQGALDSQYPTTKTLADGRMHEAVTETPTSDGVRNFRIVATPLVDHQGTVIAAIEMVEDVTERTRMQAQIAQSDRLASMGMLAAGVAHEINNPLTYILYNLECLADDLPLLVRAIVRLQGSLGYEESVRALDDIEEYTEPRQLDDMVEHARNATKGAMRVRDIVKELRTFTRVDEDRLAPVSLNDTIETAVSMAMNEIKYRAHLVKDFGQVPPLMANDGKLAQVFLNLLVNAAQAIEEGDAGHNEVRLRTWAEEGCVVAEVTDTGRGISKAHLKRLFEPFFSTKEIGVGSGLGLPICHSIVTGLGGTIEVQSELGQGTRFEVRLPVHAVQDTASDIEKPPPQPGVRGRVLIVDDEPQVADAIRRMLASEHDTVVITSGTRAMQVLAEDQRFDAIVCDLMMPQVTGIDLHGWLTESHAELANKMVFVTGGVFTQKARRFLEQVSNPQLEKPFSPANLRALVRK